MKIDIQASGNADAAYRAAKKADEFEQSRQFQEAIKMNEEASKFYLLAGAEMQNTKSVDMGAVQSFRELANVHTRKSKFLQVRLTDPTSLYDIGEIRDRLKPKWKKFEDEEKVQKGRKKPGDFLYKADKTKNEPEVE